MEVVNNTMWLGGVSVEELMEQYGSPLFIYEEDSIRQQFRKLRDSFTGVDLKIHYAMKANSNPSILKVLLEEGACVDTVSDYEVELALKVGYRPQQILYTGNNVSLEEVSVCHDKKVSLIIESLSLLEEFGATHPGAEVSIRINPGLGSGHHAHCITGGPKSKFGIYYDQLDEVKAIVDRHQLSLIGVHSHIGTGILEALPMMEALEMILSKAIQFQGLKFVDIGGGFGIPYGGEQAPLDLGALGKQVSERFQEFCEEYGSPLELKIEPGRYLVAKSGVLAGTVNNLKHTPKYRFAGMDSGFNHLLRPAMYGSFHRIVNASRMEGPQESTILAGNICETGDIFNHTSDGVVPQEMTQVQLGDRMAILNTGAYGIAMSSNYNMRARPAEVLVCNGASRLVRKRESFDDIISMFVF